MLMSLRLKRFILWLLFSFESERKNINADIIIIIRFTIKTMVKYINMGVTFMHPINVNISSKEYKTKIFTGCFDTDCFFPSFLDAIS